MDYSVHFQCFIGIIFCVFIGVATTTNTFITGQTGLEVFRDDDHRAARQKRDDRNGTYSMDNPDVADHVASSIHLLEPRNNTETPDWFQTLNDQKWYGAEFYFNRTLYRRDPGKHPTVCYNNNTRVENNTRLLLYFICPMQQQSDSLVYCCGEEGEQSCCNKQVYDEELIKLTEKDKTSHDIDLITGLTIAGACAACVTICMLLYCCCCQRRPEIHDGIKLMWVRRSFGKELSRLEQPTYPNHLAVVSSRAASRQGSRSGSRLGSHQGSRNPSRGPSPSVSRRASYERSPSRKHKVSASTSERQKLTVDIPSSVVITVTTPSDEHGPTNPLLKSMDG